MPDCELNWGQGNIDADLLAAIADDGDVEATIIGRFTSGQYFDGTDTITIISPRNDN